MGANEPDYLNSQSGLNLTINIPIFSSTVGIYRSRIRVPPQIITDLLLSVRLTVFLLRHGSVLPDIYAP